MSSEQQQNVAIVRSGYEAFGRGDVEGLLSLFDDSIQWTSPGPADLPTAGTWRGRREVADFFARVNETFEFQRFEPKEFIAQADRVVVLGEDSARVKATGKIVDSTWAHAFTLRNGKVTRFDEYIDTAAVVAELRTAQTRT